MGGLGFVAFVSEALGQEGKQKNRLSQLIHCLGGIDKTWDVGHDFKLLEDKILGSRIFR